MKNRKFYLIWLYLYILCAALGFIPSPRNPLVTALLAICAVAFFAPPALLLYRAIRDGDRRTLKRMLLLSAASLALTLLLFIGNTLTILAPDNLLLGNILNALLILVSAPMACAPYQVLGTFGWACLLFTSITNWKKTAKNGEKSKNS